MTNRYYFHFLNFNEWQSLIVSLGYLGAVLYIHFISLTTAIFRGRVYVLARYDLSAIIQAYERCNNRVLYEVQGQAGDVGGR